MLGSGWLTYRKIAFVGIAILLVPTIVAGLSHATDTASETEPGSASQPVDNLTVVASQGREPEVTRSAGGLEILNSTSKEQVWNHGVDRCMRYYDTDPIDNATLLFTANCELDGGERARLAFEYDWREDEILRVFQVPFDAHDIDRVDRHTYAVADIQHQRAYVYNYTADDPRDGATFDGHGVPDSVHDDLDWEWDFTEQYPESAGGEEGYDEDYTHLNDIDPIDGGEEFLLSPRDFNRVMLVNRTTNEVEWTVGEQDDPMTLHGQHHPVLLENDPPTVLVGDSLNHRIVEYERVNGTWELTWRYAGELNWPRSVARLPDGNTLITDTGNHRVVEVTPNGTVAWEYETTYPNPYDAVHYAHGDEGGGAPMTEVQAENSSTSDDTQAAVGGVSTLEQYHRLAGYVLPTWVGKWEFATLVGALAVTLAWILSEAGLAVRRRLE